MDKQAVRHLINQRKRQFTEQQLSRLSLAALEKVERHPKVMTAHTVLLYYSMKGEVDTHDLVDRLWQQGKTVLLPRVVSDTDMELVAYTGRDHLRAAGAFHILEPVGPPVTDYQAIDIAIIPGVAFTADGKRLGHGRGYYDRLLAAMPQVYRLGLCFPFQLLPDLPTSAFDMTMDEVVD